MTIESCFTPRPGYGVFISMKRIPAVMLCKLAMPYHVRLPEEIVDVG
jgi:hypothetical protein